MPRQIIGASAGAAVPVLEHRVAVLEQRVALLTEAVHALAAALEAAPSTTPDDGGTVSAARGTPDLMSLAG